MNISLTPELEAMVKSHVETGRYNSSSEVVREALRTWEDEQKMKELRRKLSIGEAQLDRGEGVDGEAFFDTLLEEAK